MNNFESEANLDLSEVESQSRFGEFFDSQILENTLGKKIEPDSFKGASNLALETYAQLLKTKSAMEGWHDYISKMPILRNKVSSDVATAEKKIFVNYSILRELLLELAKEETQSEADIESKFYEYVRNYNQAAAQAYPLAEDRLTRTIDIGILGSTKSLSEPTEPVEDNSNLIAK